MATANWNLVRDLRHSENSANTLAAFDRSNEEKIISLDELLIASMMARRSIACIFCSLWVVGPSLPPVTAQDGEENGILFVIMV